MTAHGSREGHQNLLDYRRRKLPDVFGLLGCNAYVVSFDYIGH
jgi:hypothetical protein